MVLEESMMLLQGSEWERRRRDTPKAQEQRTNKIISVRTNARERECVSKMSNVSRRDMQARLVVQQSGLAFV
jgi:uncharacterized protein YcsI (UPF0317 family)